MDDSLDSDCAPSTDPTGKECTLPSGAKDFASSPPNIRAIDKAIEARFGPATSSMSQMKTTDLNGRFSGPGQA